MNLFYAPDLSGKYYTFNNEESKHIVKVLRKTTTDLVHLTDGRGFMFEGQITEANPKACKVEIIKKEAGDDQRNFKLHIAIAPTKNINRFEWFLEKCTEIGIYRITPIFCKHSERKVIKNERVFRVVISAVKQSLKSVVPILDEPTTFHKLVTNSGTGLKYIAWLGDDGAAELSDIYIPGEDALVLIGPEGDFSEDEVKLALANGFKPVKLGPSRLRTETAGVAACHTINLLNY